MCVLALEITETITQPAEAVEPTPVVEEKNNEEVLKAIKQFNNLFKKSITAISAEIIETTINVGANQKFATATITDTNILQILNVTSSDGNQWYEVPYLAQSSIFKSIANPSYNTDQVPYLLQLQSTPRRFVSRILSDNTLQLEFGAGFTRRKSLYCLRLPLPRR